MAEFTERHIKLIEESHDTLNTLKSVLLGANGNPGLVKQVNDVCEDHQSLKARFWMLVAFLTGLGIIGGGTVGALELLKR